jgi:hypothetical protein
MEERRDKWKVMEKVIQKRGRKGKAPKLKGMKGFSH